MDVQGTDRIACKDITATISDDMFALFSMPAMRRLMPLTTGVFDEAACQRTLEAKAVMWRDFGFGPRAFEIDGRFAGWGGVQPEQGEADIGLGLHPDYWGWSRAVQMPALAWR